MYMYTYYMYSSDLFWTSCIFLKFACGASVHVGGRNEGGGTACARAVGLGRRLGVRERSRALLECAGHGSDRAVCRRGSQKRRGQPGSLAGQKGLTQFFFYFSL